MAFQFPNNPTIGQQVPNTASGQTFTWGGTSWNTAPVTSSQAITSSFATTASFVIGSNWSVNETTVITATTTAPNKGTTTQDYTRYRQVNSNTYEVQVNFTKTGGGSDGSGNYILNLPAGLTFSANTPKTTSLAVSTIAQFLLPAAGTFTDGTGRFRPLGIVPYNNTQYRIATMGSDTLIAMFGTTGVRMTLASVLAFKLQFYTNF
jgi:hypothetical protein